MIRYECKCEIPEKGSVFCKRHNCKKSPRLIQLCHAGQRGESPGVKYWRAWEEGRGPGQTLPPSLTTKPLTKGPGTQLKRLFQWFKITANRGCQCKQWAALMDLRGCDWCEANLETVIGWLRKEAAVRKLPFTDAVARRVVKLAIYLARREESSPIAFVHPMALTQLLCFELGSDCNLSDVHDRCPNQHPERYSHLDTDRLLDDDTIVEIAERMYDEFHFTGFVAFHYYNEPLVQAQRMFGLIDRIRERVSQARFLLWTNGTMLPDDCSRFIVFDQVYLTNHDPKSVRNLDSLRRHVSKVVVLDNRLDGRLDALGETERNNPCARMHVEFVIDNFGNVHICCHDWRGLASPGNVFTDDLTMLVARWERIRDSISGQQMTNDAPEVCWRCRMRTAGIDVFEPRIVKQIKAFRRLWKLGTGLKVAVVLCHYEIPDWRLREHFEWNDRLYRQADVRVYVVTDKPYDMPDYAEYIVYPKEDLPTIDGKPAFWITGLKNVGVKQAIAAGGELIICSDTDIAYTPKAWERMITIGPDEAIIPIYHKAKYFERRHKEAHADPGCEGVIAMWAEHWATCPWEEKCVGYGADDRVQHDRIEENLKIRVSRDVVVYHIDHHPQDGIDHGPSLLWNADGLNPANFQNNRQYVRKRRRTHKWQPEKAKP